MVLASHSNAILGFLGSEEPKKPSANLPCQGLGWRFSPETIQSEKYYLLDNGNACIISLRGNSNPTLCRFSLITVISNIILLLTYSVDLSIILLEIIKYQVSYGEYNGF